MSDPPYHGDVVVAAGVNPDLSSLIRNLRDFVYVVDLEGNFLFMNTNLIHAMGYSDTEARELFLGKSFLNQLTPASQRIAGEHFERALRDEPISPYFEVETLCKDGSTILLEVHGSHYYQDGRRQGRQGVARDITELRSLQNALAQSTSRLELMEQQARLAGELLGKLSMLVGGGVTGPGGDNDWQSANSDRAMSQLDLLVRRQRQSAWALDDTNVAILQGLCQGETTEELAHRVALSPHTVKDRIENMMESADVRKRASLVAWAVRKGLV